jgi:glutamate synthase (NADPH/NADH) small chain
LRKLGHRVIVFEALDKPGGLNTLGIAAYKITTPFALSEVKRIRRLGMDIRYKQPIDGRKLARLLSEYDAVFLAIGLGPTAALGIPGEGLPGVWESLAFIFQTHTRPLEKCRVGKQVVVIGGGNTAIDAAVAAKKLGAEHVTIAYRRDRHVMPAFEHEYELAVAEGVQFEWLAKPIRVMGRNRKVAGVRFARTRLQGKGRKAKVVTVRGGDFTLPADMVIKALGQQPLLDLLQAVPRLKIDKDGRVVIDPATQATSVPKLFVGGDCQQNAGEEVVNAVQAGKIAAKSIHQSLVPKSVG